MYDYAVSVVIHLFTTFSHSLETILMSTSYVFYVGFSLKPEKKSETQSRHNFDVHIR